MEYIKDKTFDEERALYNLKNTKVINCIFTGPQDGESVLKESRNIEVENCTFSLRYPIWHNHTYKLLNSKLDVHARAPLWYTSDGEIRNTEIASVKALRESMRVSVKESSIDSKEFGWKCNHIKIENSNINSDYIFFDSSDVEIKNLNFTGKYSFQYMNNLTITDSNLDTKDAFWHSKNVTVKNSMVKGEYLGWFSENLTLENCKIIGTQPLCYCKNLTLIDCEMIDADLSFEYSEVEASIKGHIGSIKNPKSGTIIVDSIGEIIREDSIMEDSCQIIVNGEES